MYYVKSAKSARLRTYFLITRNVSIKTSTTENTNPKTATKDISPTLGPDSETKTMEVAIMFAPKTIAKIRLMIFDLMS